MTTLNEQLLRAHAAGDHVQLVRLYTKAADQVKTEQEAGFFLTHAYIFALEIGMDEAAVLRARLVSMGRESPS
ncbi:MAG: hypothetical protein AB8B47_03375 [Roseobacter sp.]